MYEYFYFMNIRIYENCFFSRMPHYIENAKDQPFFFSLCLYGVLTLEFCTNGYEFSISKP